MGKIKMDMSGESNFFDGEAGDYRAIVDDVKIVTAEDSKSGNAYFVWSLMIDSGKHAGQHFDVRTTAIKGKRWLLKQGLGACGIQPDEKGIFNFDVLDLKDKIVGITVKVYDDTFIDQMGKQKTMTKREVNKFYSVNKIISDTLVEKAEAVDNETAKEEIPF